jgi:hypothetical protein
MDVGMIMSAEFNQE